MGNVIYPYKGVFIAGYIITGFLLFFFMMTLIYIKTCAGKPRFFKYDNNNINTDQED